MAPATTNTTKPSARRGSAIRKGPVDTTARDITLITGASAGIGEALAGEFARGGSHLVLVARSRRKLEQIADRLASEHGIKAEPLPADLSLPGAADRLKQDLLARKLHVDTLVNNAGILEMGRFAEIEAVRHRELIQLNIVAVTELTRLFLPAMIERRRGRILNVASIAAFQPVPSLACYAATKAYVLSLTEALSEELKPHGVTATALCPGITDTDMVAAIKDDNTSASKIPGFLIGNAAAVAAEGYAACVKAEVIRVPGIFNLAASVVGRASPRWLVRAVSGALGGRRSERLLDAASLCAPADGMGPKEMVLQHTNWGDR